MRKKTQFKHEFPRSRHHLIPKSRGGIVTNKIEQRIHTPIHILFLTKIITEKIWKLIEMDSDVLTEPFKKAVWDIIQDPQFAYKKEAFKNTTSYRKLKNNF